MDMLETRLKDSYPWPDGSWYFHIEDTFGKEFIQITRFRNDIIFMI